MKITDPRIIQTEEKKLITAVQAHLDPETVRKILMNRITETAFTSKGGQIVVHDNQIAFRLDFDLQLSGSLLFDRQGNYIPVPGDDNPEEDELDLMLDETELDNRDRPVEDEAGLEQRTADHDPDDDVLLDDDILDDDIDDILKESREFWEEKKGS